MRRLLAPLLVLASPALAEADASALIAAEGLRGAEAALAALPSPTPSERFALGGVRFLGGVERALQLRYRVGLSDGLAVLSGLPVLRLPLPENPSPDPFEPAMIADLFAGVEADMAGAIEVLATIRDDDEVAVMIDAADLWFDIDADGARGAGEGLMEVAGVLLDPGFGFEAGFEEAPPAPLPAPVIRFDTADAAWLSAYAHLLSGVGEAMLALDPTEAIGRVVESREGFATLGQTPEDPFGLDAQFGATADLLAMVVMTLEGQPDPARSRALRDHLLAVVAENRRFWTLVAREGDDNAEWIPNKRQASALGLPFPPDTGPRWLAVLADAEGVLTGRLLLPHWRLGAGAGVDLGALLEDPPPLDLAGLIQGAALLPYMREGPLANAANLAAFSQLVQGDAALYALVIN